MAFERVILPLMWARTPDDVQCIGTLFVIANAGHLALAFTARHTIEHVRRMSGVENLAELRVPKIFRKSLGLSVALDPSLIERRVTAEGFLVSGMVNGPTIEIIGCDHLSHEDMDIALITLRIDPSQDQQFDIKAALQSKGPKVGDRVQLFGFHSQSDATIETLPGVSVTATFQLNFKWLEGEVVSLHQWGEDRLVKAPCFRVNCPVDGGFSGGPALLLSDNGFDAPAVGMISASDEAETVVSLLYPILAIRNPIPGPPGTENPKSLLGLCALGAIIDKSEAHRHLRFRSDDPHGNPNDFAVWDETD